MQLANPYIKQYLMVGLSTGMRLKELLNLKYPNLDTYLKHWLHPRIVELQKRSIAHRETLLCNKDGQPIKSFKTAYNHLIRLGRGSIFL